MTYFNIRGLSRRMYFYGL